MMRGIKDKGAQELHSFDNRLRRSFAMGRLEPEDYQRLAAKAQDLINDVASVNEDDPSRREF